MLAHPRRWSQLRLVGPAVLAIIGGSLRWETAAASGEWRWTASIESARPSGWVQVRENAIEGTRLWFENDLRVQHRNGIRLDATKIASSRSEWRLSVATYTLDGTTVLSNPIYFNGATIAAGRLRTATDYTHFLEFDGSYRRRFLAFGEGGGLWGSVGGTFMLLNFTLRGTVAPGSAGSETTEAFYVQELPVPVLGLHVKYPVGRNWSVISSATVGGLPRVDSLRHEGGEVRLKQTNDSLSLGGAFRRGHWELSLSAFGRYYAQDEQSREDGNVIHLRDRGLALGVGRPF
jgi:hypothetical protein